MAGSPRLRVMSPTPITSHFTIRVQDSSAGRCYRQLGPWNGSTQRGSAEDLPDSAWGNALAKSLAEAGTIGERQGHDAEKCSQVAVVMALERGETIAGVRGRPIRKRRERALSIPRGCARTNSAETRAR